MRDIKFICSLLMIFAVTMREEAIAAVLLVIALLIPVFAIGFKWAAIMRKENRRVGRALFEEDDDF